MPRDMGIPNASEMKIKMDATKQLMNLKTHCHREEVSALERAAKDKFMMAGSMAARQVSQVAALEGERVKLAALRLKASRYGASSGHEGGDGVAGVAARLAGAGATWGVADADAATQTEDAAETARQEAQRLRTARDALLAATRHVPKNTATMVDLLKKRNAVLLAREERALQRLRAERLAKEQRVRQLEDRVARLRASTAPAPPPAAKPGGDETAHFW